MSQLATEEDARLDAVLEASQPTTSDGAWARVEESQSPNPRRWYYNDSMEMFKTALGRLVPANEVQTVLEDAVLRLLFDYRINSQNPNNVPMKLSHIVHGVLSDEKFVIAALDALKEDVPPLVEEREKFQGERAFSISGGGVRLVRNMPQEIVSVL